MDLATLKANDTGTVELVHPLTGPTGVVFTLKGPHTPEMKAKMQAVAEARAREQRRQVTPTLSSLEAHGLDLLSAAVEGWTELTDAGEPFPCTEENVRALLGKNDWIREQVEAAFTSHATFLRRKVS